MIQSSSREKGFLQQPGAFWGQMERGKKGPLSCQEQKQPLQNILTGCWGALTQHWGEEQAPTGGKFGERNMTEI